MHYRKEVKQEAEKPRSAKRSAGRGEQEMREAVFSFLSSLRECFLYTDIAETMGNPLCLCPKAPLRNSLLGGKFKFSSLFYFCKYTWLFIIF